MKVLILANNDVGLYKFRKELLERLVSEKHTVYVSLPQGEFIEEIQNIGCKYIETYISRHGTNPFQDLKLLINYIFILRKIKPDMVFTYTIKPNVYGGMLCALMDIPYVANVTGLGNSIQNGGPLQKICKFLYAKGLKKAKKIFFQNCSNKALFESWGIVHDNAQLIPGSGVNLSYHTPANYPDDSTGTRFLFIARIMQAKGIDELLAAMEQVHRKYPQATLDIVGGLDGNYQAVMDSLKGSNYITYHGNQSDVRTFIRRTHCTVLPSHHEGMANVLLESASAARPVIASKVPGCQETFDEGISGFGCMVRNADSLAEAMMKFIELPYEKKREMGIAGRKKMEREYDRNIVVNAYMNTLK